MLERKVNKPFLKKRKGSKSKSRCFVLKSDADIVGLGFIANLLQIHLKPENEAQLTR